MTLSPKIQEAIETASNARGERYGFAVDEAWRTIKDHVVKQDKEIDDLRKLLSFWIEKHDNLVSNIANLADELRNE